jgi:hypothetical protein
MWWSRWAVSWESGDGDSPSLERAHPDADYRRCKIDVAQMRLTAVPFPTATLGSSVSAQRVPSDRG